MAFSRLVPVVLAAVAFLASAATAQTARPFQPSVLTHPNGTVYVIPQAITIAFSPTNPDLLLVGDILGTLHLLRVAQTSWTSYVVTATEDRLFVGDGRSILGLASDPFDPTVFFLASNTIMWQARGLGPAGWQNGKIERVRLLRKQAKLIALGDFITGLPVSDRPSGNGVFSPVVDSKDSSLYVPISSGTGLGVNGTQSNNVPDTLLSASVLRVDIRSKAKTRALKWTSDAPDRASLVDPPAVTGVELFASGVRSVFQPVYTMDGRLLALDGGANLSDGEYSETCTIAQPFKVPEPDRVLLLKRGRYYGTPNRVRGKTDPTQCVYIRPTDTVDAGKFPNYEAPLATTADAVARGDLFGGITGLAQYNFEWTAAVRRGSLIATAFDTPKDETIPNAGSAGILSFDLHTGKFLRVGDGAGGTVAINVAGALFTTLTTKGRIGVYTPVVPEQRSKERRVAGVWPPRGRPGSRLHVVGTRLPWYRAVLVDGVPCTKTRRLRRYVGLTIVSCRVPRLVGGKTGLVALQIGSLRMENAFNVL